MPGGNLMKYKLLTAVLITALILTLLSSCSTGSIDKQFINALKKSSSIQKASSTINLNINLDLENSNLSSEEKTMLNAYRNINISLITKKDLEKKLSLIEGNIFLNGMNINFKLYQKDSKSILEIPALGKYIVLNEKSQSNIDLDETTQVELMSIIDEVLTKDNIKKAEAEKSLTDKDTSDVTGFEVVLSDSEIKSTLIKAVDLLLSDKQLKSYMKDLINNNTQETKTDTETEDILNSLLNEVKQGINDIKIENFLYKGAFDESSIIINEDLSSDLTIQLPETKYFKMNIKISKTTYDIDKYLDFALPTVDELNSILIDDLYNMMNNTNY